ncbi:MULTISPECIES: hypothetical protein [Stenotrophomonas]|uniref:antitoxin PaaA2 family protein n=1 Tax=Stenotrophomonas TaxID=40323 RepID=UPI002D7671D1|nr:hypothetical protein [Stenotrophomonas sp. ZAC14D2_NAIMI4_6]
MAESYNQWLRAKIERAIADARPAIHHDQVVARVRATIDAASMSRKVAEGRCICSGTLRRLRSCRLRALASWAQPWGRLLRCVPLEGCLQLRRKFSQTAESLLKSLAPAPENIGSLTGRDSCRVGCMQLLA